jgi:hypothetical protein
MSRTRRPTGHLQVKTDKNVRVRSFWAFWRDGGDRKGGRRLGPTHVRDSGRRTPRGAVVWRAGHGSKPSPEYLTPKEAQACLETILEELRAAAEIEHIAEHTLQQAVEGWLMERKGERGLKRSTVAGYEDMFERMFRDLGADTPLHSLADGRLRWYFADFKAYRVLSETKARQALAEGKNVQQLAYSPRPDLADQITRALDPHSLPANVRPTRPAPAADEATFLERLEEEIPAKWLREVQRLYAETGAPFS